MAEPSKTEMPVTSIVAEPSKPGRASLSIEDQVKRQMQVERSTSFQVGSMRYSDVPKKPDYFDELGIEYQTEEEEDDLANRTMREFEERYHSESGGRFERMYRSRSQWWSIFLNLKRKQHRQQLKDGAGHPYPWSRRIVCTQAFEVFLSSMIIGNCFFIGWQAEQFEPDDTVDLIISILEHFFTAGFLVELVLRALCYQWTFFFDSANYLDIFLVVLSVLTTWILAPFNVQVDFLRKLTLLRILRLSRLARQVKNRPEFKEMWMLIRGLGDSMETLFWTYVMIGCVLYFFAIMATSIMAKQGAFDEPESAKELAEENFSDVPTSMFTLFQVMTLDSWTGLMRPLMDVHAWVFIFFIVFISVAEFMLMNLVTAVIVKNAFERSQEDKADLAVEMEKEKEKDLAELQLFFDDMDADKSGTLTFSEIIEAYKNRKIRNFFTRLDIGPKDLDALWTALDDGDGELTIDEFCGGMRKLKGYAKAKDILRLYKEVRFLESSVKEISDLSEAGHSKMRTIKMKIGATFRELDATRRTLRRMKEACKVAVKAQAFS